MFSGDSIFAESIGRTDFPGGSYEDLLDSIKSKILPLGDSIILLPGHGPSTTIGHEKMYNPFLR
jgi:glyoxylase-like metal-dependent hydrolase (beta-lactamase superfamily II)